MPYRYYNNRQQPDAGYAFGEGLGQGFSNTLEAIIMQKLRNKQAEDELKRQFLAEGRQPIVQGAPTQGEDFPNQGQYSDVGYVGNQGYGKLMTQADREQSDLDRRERLANIAYKEAQAKAYESGVPLYDPETGRIMSTVPKQAKPLSKSSQDQQSKKEFAKAKASYADAKSFVDVEIPQLTKILELNKNSYGGAVGSLKYKTKSALDIGEKDETFRNTAEVINYMQSLVAKVLKSTFGGQLSDAEREYLNNIYGALPNMSKVEREIAISNVMKTINNNLGKAESRLNELGGSAGTQGNQSQQDIDPLGVYNELP